MAIIDTIKAKARARVMHIVLPEGEETRNVHAASIIQKEGLARLTLLGDAEKIKAAYPDVCLCGVEIVNPATSEKAPEYAAKLYELRKAKGMTEEKAAELVKDPMYYGVLMVKCGDADGLVSGAIHSTGDMLRPALQIIKTKPGMKSASSCFLMETSMGVMIFADCAVIPLPRRKNWPPSPWLRRIPRARWAAWIPRWPCFPSPPRAAPSTSWWTKWWKPRASPRNWRPTCRWTANCSWTPRSCPRWAN